VNQTGNISEDEFVPFFRQVRMYDLQQQLAKNAGLDGDQVNISIVDFDLVGNLPTAQHLTLTL